MSFPLPVIALDSKINMFFPEKFRMELKRMLTFLAYSTLRKQRSIWNLTFRNVKTIMKMFDF